MAAALPPLAKAGYTRKEAYDRLAQVALLARLSTKTPEAVAGMIADIRDGKAGPRKLQSFFGAAISSVPRAATDEEEAALPPDVVNGQAQEYMRAYMKQDCSHIIGAYGKERSKYYENKMTQDVGQLLDAGNEELTNRQAAVERQRYMEDKGRD